MEEYLSQQSTGNIPYKTTKHSNHDNYWLLPGITTSLFCFGCAIENLEDVTLLKFRKKHILTDLLEIFLTNNTIWQLFGSNSSVHAHVVKILLDILIQSDDKELGVVTSQLCLLIAKRTSPERIATIVTDQLSSKSKNFSNQGFMHLLTDLVVAVPSIVINICDDKALFIVELLNFISTCKKDLQLCAWSLLTSILKAICVEDVSISQKTLKQILQTLIQVNVTSIVVDIEVLKCLHSFLCIKNAQVVVFQLECSLLTTSTSSALEYIKKMLLCSNEEGKTVAISCLNIMAEMNDSEKEATDAGFSSLLNLIIQKGITEYLLELLSSSNATVVQELFKCLEKMTRSKKFHSLGHMVYGFSTVIKCLMATTDVACSIQGLRLIDIILKGRLNQSDRINFTKPQTAELIELLRKSFECPDEQVKTMASHCMCSFLMCVKSLSRPTCEVILNLLELLFLYIERDFSISTNLQLKKHQIDFVNNSYDIVLQFVSHIKKQMETDSTNSADNHKDSPFDDIHETLFFFCDKYFIPQAVVKFLPRQDIKFQTIFYQIVLHIMELDKHKGEMLASKICQSSFLGLIYQFKVVAGRASSNNSNLTGFLGKLLMYLCMSTEAPDVHQLYDTNFLESITYFNVPMQEWRTLLDNDNQNVDYIDSHQTVLLTMLACSHMADCPLVPLPTLQPFLEKLGMNTRRLLTLSVLAKRYYLYLCCQINMSGSFNPVTQIQIGQVITGTATEHVLLLLHNSPNFLVWLLKLNISSRIFQMCLEIFFRVAEAEITELTSTLQQHNCLFIFMEFCIKLLCAITDSDMQQAVCSYIQSVMCHVGGDKHDYLKHLIHKTLLLTEEFNHAVITVYCRLINTLTTQSTIGVSEEDLKLLCRILEYIGENTLPTLLVEALQYCYLILSKAVETQDIKPVSIVMKYSRIATMFSKKMFNNQKAIESSKSTLLVELLHSVIVLVTTRLLQCVQMFAINMDTKLVVRKEIVIELCACANLPLLQLSLACFWNVVFSQQLRPTMLEFVGEDGEHSQLTEDDLHLLMIALQNLYFHQEGLLCSEAAYCHLALVRLPATKALVSNPWSRLFRDNIRDSIASSNCVNISSVIMHQSFFDCTHKPEMNKTITDIAFHVISKTVQEVEKGVNEERSNLVVVVVEYVKIFLDQFLNQLEYETLKRFKVDLKNLDKTWKTNATSITCTIKDDSTSNALHIINVFGLFFQPNARRLLLRCDVSSTVNGMRKQLEKRITEIDDDETESDDEMQ